MDKIIDILAICVCVFLGLIILWFTYNFIQLKEFRKCYEINFESNYCERYRNY